MKYVSIRKPDTAPFGETLREASVLATVAALVVNRPEGGCVESVASSTDTCFRYEEVSVEMPKFIMLKPPAVRPSHSSGRGRKPNSRLAFALEAPRRLVAL